MVFEVALSNCLFGPHSSYQIGHFGLLMEGKRRTLHVQTISSRGLKFEEDVSISVEPLILAAKSDLVL